jgi:hypothetical protein
VSSFDSTLTSLGASPNDSRSILYRWTPVPHGGDFPTKASESCFRGRGGLLRADAAELTLASGSVVLESALPTAGLCYHSPVAALQASSRSEISARIFRSWGRGAPLVFAGGKFAIAISF